MNTPVITFDPAGNGHCLFTEVIDLSALGALDIHRVSSIEFTNVTQLWELKDTDGVLLLSHPSRQACLDWEHQHFDP
jgi:hypothetical protein